LLAVAAFIGTLAGCGDEEREEAGATATGTTATEEHAQEPAGRPVATIEMSETDFALDPAEPRVDETGVVEFAISNDGEAPHNLEVETPEGEFELEQDLEPGETATLKAELPEPGEYVMYCPVGDHRERGMEGTITVGGGGGGESGGEAGDSGGGTPGY
jgi:plastocyanin